MIFILNTFINLVLIFVCWRLAIRKHGTTVQKFYYVDKAACAKIDKALIRGAIAEKFAERAFSLASSANIGVVALQKTLQTRPRVPSRENLLRNELAKREVDSLFQPSGSFDWLRPILSDEENDLLDQVEEHQKKHGNGKIT